MRAELCFAGLSMSALFVAVIAGAHAVQYVNSHGEGDFGLTCQTEFSPGFGGVCYDAGHISPDAQGFATVRITDDLISPVSGYYCQDFDADGLCGESFNGQNCPPRPNPHGAAIRPAAGGCGDIFEPERVFCDQQTLDTNTNWLETATVYIMVDGPIFGDPVFSPCGSYSAGTNGLVSHT